MDLQQQHAGTVDKQGTNWPCTFWSRHQYEKNPTTSTMTERHFYFFKSAPTAEAYPTW